MIGAVLVPVSGSILGEDRTVAYAVEPRGCRSPVEAWAWCYRLAVHLLEAGLHHPRDLRVESIGVEPPGQRGDRLHANGAPRVRIAVHGDTLARELRAAVNGAIVRVSEERR